MSCDPNKEAILDALAEEAHEMYTNDGVYGEQAWIDSTPIFFHATRGGYRNNDALTLWVNEVENYFNIKK